MKNQFEKLISLSLMIILSLALLAGCTTSKEEGGPSSNKIRIAIQPYPLYTPIYVAKELGTLEKALKESNVEVEWSSFKSGPLVNESFASGQQDIGAVGDVPAIIAKSSGQNNIIISNAAYGEKALAVLVKSGSTIKDPSQLKGKKIAYVKGSYAHHLLYVVLEKAGLTLNDIESVNLAAGDIPSAIESGEVDAGVLWEPFITQLVNKNRVEVLVDGTNIKRGNLVVIATKDYATKNPEAIQTFLKVYNEAAQYIVDNPKEAAKLVADDFGLSEDELVEVFKNFNYTPKISDEDIAELKVVEEFLRKEKLTSSEVNIDEFVDTSYLKDSGLLD